MLKKRQMTNSLNSSLKQGLSLEHLWPLNRKLKTKMRPFPALRLRTLNKEKVEREFINLTSHYQQISESFRNLVEEVPHMRKHQLATHLTDMPILPMIKVTTEEKVSSMYGQ